MAVVMRNRCCRSHAEGWRADWQSVVKDRVAHVDELIAIYHLRVVAGGLESCPGLLVGGVEGM